MKRYLVFAGDVYYPEGGWKDFQGSYDTREEAFLNCPNKESWDGWGHVVDSEVWMIIQPD